MKKNDLRDAIAACGCATCRALTSINADAGANILISRINTGRMCELAVVAAAGPGGLAADEVVARRAAYARHLGVELPAETLKRLTPFHIEHAIEFSNHTRPGQSDNQPVNLGRARGSHADGRFFLVWDTAPTSGRVSAPFAVSATASARRGDAVTQGIEIAWPDGIERIELDLRNLGLHTQVTDTVQHIDEPAPGYRARYEYETTSAVTAQPDGVFRLVITYAHENNRHIREDDSWWGTTTLMLRPGDTAGTVQWTDANDPASNGEYTFHAATWSDEDDDDECQLRADEAAIERRDNLTSTEKLQLVKARRGQGKFRVRVLRKEPHCRLTGIDDPAHLRASHIKPWAGSDDRERLDGNNGLMLAPHVDHLFDKAYISFDDEGRVLVLDHPAVHALLAAWKIDPAAPALPARPFNARQRAFLAEHRQRLARRQAG